MTYRDLELDRRLPEPKPVHFRYDQFEPDTDFEFHIHPWGQLSRINLGLMQVDLEDRKLTAPAEYLIWVPARTAHSAFIRQSAEYVSVYVCDALAHRLPSEGCLIVQSPLARALFDDFCARRVSVMSDEWDVRQAELLIEHLARAGRADSYLPDSEDRQLEPILKALRLDPSDTTPLAEWARRVHGTERTLARRFQAELGMSFIQWRNRVRMLRALAWLKEEVPVHEIAARLNYSTPSAFIAMFRKQTGCSPQRYRLQSTDV
ncbi:AraC family transcriptional regulator [Pararobbsia silviterrae]|uniref:AraC family transcriptional regulator n=1 Tax=Pararobbsia silviterrae TaxID=1792498 RepID=A0A494XGM0_9BURK|nr:helix-turn-helix transcriptional regulator [Pararobbsia silviterrae]RKP47716.1 AraC family transcriptional regulator [Pararobbsia silviterrae]